MAVFGNFGGTTEESFAIGDATFNASGLTAPRSLVVPNSPGTLGLDWKYSNIIADPTDPIAPTFYRLSASSSSWTFTLPSVSAFGAGMTLGFWLATVSGTNTVKIQPASGESILGFVAEAELFVSGDSLVLINTGSAWIMFNDGRIKHMARLVRNTGQSLANATNTRIEMNSAIIDNAALYDATNKRVLIRRGGVYEVTVSSWTPEGMTAGTDYMTMGVYRNGSSQISSVKHVGNTNNVSDCVTTIVSCSASNYLDMYMAVAHSGGSTTITSGDRCPTISVREL